jgi:hypothetical protein
VNRQLPASRLQLRERLGSPAAELVLHLLMMEPIEAVVMSMRPPTADRIAPLACCQQSVRIIYVARLAPGRAYALARAIAELVRCQLGVPLGAVAHHFLDIDVA